LTGFLEARFKHPIHHVKGIAIVIPKLELIQVQRQILARDFVEHAHDAALEQAPDVLYAVHVYVTINVPLGVLD